jgi:hypothetical protein
MSCNAYSNAMADLRRRPSPCACARRNTRQRDSWHLQRSNTCTHAHGDQTDVRGLSRLNGIHSTHAATNFPSLEGRRGAELPDLLALVTVLIAEFVHLTVVLPAQRLQSFARLVHLPRIHVHTTHSHPHLDNPHPSAQTHTHTHTDTFETAGAPLNPITP